MLLWRPSGSSKVEYDVTVGSHVKQRCFTYSSRTDGCRDVGGFRGTPPDDVGRTSASSLVFDHRHQQKQQQQQRLIKCRHCPFTTKVRVSKCHRRLLAESNIPVSPNIFHSAYLNKTKTKLE